MKLRNKKTGEIGYPYFQNWKEISCVIVDENAIQIAKYNSLAELNEEWEDYEGQKEWYWFIEDNGVIQRSCHYEDLHPTLDKARKDIGNHFSSREEAELAVRKLKAWKRLKGGGFEFMSRSYGHDKTTDDTGGWIRFRVNHLYDERYGCEVEKDLDLLFGGEE